MCSYKGWGTCVSSCYSKRNPLWLEEGKEEKEKGKNKKVEPIAFLFNNCLNDGTDNNFPKYYNN